MKTARAAALALLLAAPASAQTPPSAIASVTLATSSFTAAIVIAS